MSFVNVAEQTNHSAEVGYALIQYRLSKTSQFIIREETIMRKLWHLERRDRSQIYVEFHSSHTLQAVLFVWSEGCAQCLFLLGKQICCGKQMPFAFVGNFDNRLLLWQFSVFIFPLWLLSFMNFCVNVTNYEFPEQFWEKTIVWKLNKYVGHEF
jgi:hypothetical protein